MIFPAAVMIKFLLLILVRVVHHGMCCHIRTVVPSTLVTHHAFLGGSVGNAPSCSHDGFALRATCDNVMRIYVDGILIHEDKEFYLDKRQWSKDVLVQVPPNSNILDVECWNYGGPYGISVSSDEVSLYTGGSWICSSNVVSDDWFRTFDYRVSHTPTALLHHRPAVGGIHQKARWIWPSSGQDKAHCKQCLCCEHGITHKPSHSGDSSDPVVSGSGDSSDSVVSAESIEHERFLDSDEHSFLDLNSTDVFSHDNLSLSLGRSKDLHVPEFSLGSKEVIDNDVNIIEPMEYDYISTDITNEKSDDGYEASSRGYFLATLFFLVTVLLGAIAKLNGYLVCKDQEAGSHCDQSDCELGYIAGFKTRED